MFTKILSKFPIDYKQLPNEIRFAFIKRIVVSLVVFLAGIFTFSLPYILFGLFITIVLLVFDCLWLIPFLKDDVYIFTGKVVFKNDTTDLRTRQLFKGVKTSAQNYVEDRYIRKKYTLLLADNESIEVVYTKRPKLVNNMWVTIYIKKSNIIRQTDMTYLASSVLLTQKLGNVNEG